jgi:hypothetical protein
MPRRIVRRNERVGGMDGVRDQRFQRREMLPNVTRGLIEEMSRSGMSRDRPIDDGRSTEEQRRRNVSLVLRRAGRGADVGFIYCGHWL